MTGRQTRPGGKAALPPKRRYRETPEVVSATRRLIRSWASESPRRIRTASRCSSSSSRKLRSAWAVAIAGLRRSGFADREIGDALGTTRQAVEQRWPREQT